MPDSFYNDLANTADELLREFGMPVTLVNFGEAVRDLESGRSVAPETAFNATGLSLSYNAYELNGTAILATDRKVLLSPVGIAAPKKGSKITTLDPVSGAQTTYTAEDVSVLAPAGIPVLYEVQARK